MIRASMHAVVLFCLAAVAEGQDVVYPGPQDVPPNDSFNPAQLASTLVVPETRVARFRFPVLDAHSHAYAETP